MDASDRITYAEAESLRAFADKLGHDVSLHGDDIDSMYDVVVLCDRVKDLMDRIMKNETTQTDRARCPGCGMPTVPDREDLSNEEKLCEQCHAED